MKLRVDQKSVSRKKTRKLGAIQQKILLLLLGGIALSCVRSPNKSLKIVKEVSDEWRDINKQSTNRAIQALYESNLVEQKENNDGTITIVLNEDGKERALTYQVRKIRVSRPNIWDKKWWVVLFDIPEHDRESRDAFRDHLDDMGFLCLQKSVWVYPFNCKNEIDFIVESLAIKKHVRLIIADHIDNVEHIKQFFNLDQV